mmetsp:Transcript_45256/g.61374  ORF Transcript_45256/g.61374 Transcript_45256/m.61374 type:complete len:297 (+) Transcript_45256:794-1684(+)
MDSGKHRDGFFGTIDTSEDVSSLKNTWETLLQGFRRQMVQVKVDVILLRTDTTTFKDFHGHRSRNNISGGEIFGSRGISLHKAFTVGVSEDTTFTTATFSHEATSTVDTSRVELNEFRILNGQVSTGNHTVTITSASMSGGAGEVSSTVTTGGHDSSVSAHSVDSTISHVVSHNTTAFSVFHKKVHSEVFDEEDAIITKSSSHQGMKHRVASSVSNSAASVSLTSLTEILRLSTESSLVDHTLIVTRERHTVGLELSDGNWCLSGHVVDGVLVTEPVTTLDCIIEVPSPVIFVHVT